MKRASTTLSIVLLLCVCEAIAHGATRREIQENWLITGVQYGGLSGSGTAGNSFDTGTGVLAELGFFDSSGWGVAFLSTGANWSENHVRGDSEGVRFYTPYHMQVHKFFRPQDSLRPFYSIGLGWNRMHFESARGSDNQLLVSAGIGVRIKMGRSPIIAQAKAGYYLVFWNDLGQKTGREVQISLGIEWESVLETESGQ